MKQKGDRRRGADDAKDGERHRANDPWAHARHRNEARDAEGEIDKLCDKYADDVTDDADLRQERPDEKNAHGSVDDVIHHGVKLLTESLEHAVHRGVQIHHGNEHGEYADIADRFLVSINEHSQRFCKKEKDPTHADAEKQRKGERAPHDIADMRMSLDVL